MKKEEIRIRDPFILSFEGKYYMYGSRVGEQQGFDVYISEDLENWRGPKAVFEYYDGFWGEKEFWAPEVHLYQDKVYMFATFKRTGLCRGTAILVSESPEGPFVEHSNGAVTPADWECLDGTLYISPDGIPYMVFCHEWVQVKDGEICLQQLSEDLSQAVGNPIVLFKASEAEWVRPINNEGDAFVTDGPFLYRCENGKLLMLWSSFGKYGYAEAIAESENGKIEGPWKQSNQLLFEKDGGHGMIFEDVHENKYVVLHAPNISYNERPALYKIIEKDNWIFRANEQG